MKLAGFNVGINNVNKIVESQDFDKLISGAPMYEGQIQEKDLGVIEEDLNEEIKALTKDCSTCDDHLKDDLTLKEIDEKKHILKEGRDAEAEFKRKHF